MNYLGNQANSDGTFPSEMPLAMAYVPVQKIRYIYEPDNALMQGTLFPELDKPFLGGRSMNKMMSGNANTNMQSNPSDKSNTGMISGAANPGNGISPYGKGYEK